MPHLLYLAWGFPPSRSGGVYRARATANAFAEHGWDVTVLTARREDFARYTGTDDSLEARVHPGVDVVRIPFTWPAQETDIRRYGAVRALGPPLWHRWRRRLDQFPFPEPGYGPWRSPLTEAADRVHQRRPVDLTLATANPFVPFAAAQELYRRHDVPYVMDHRDAWRLDIFSGRTLHARDRAARWERRLVGTAAEVWFVNQPILDWHARRYPGAVDRMHVVANGWDRDLLTPTPPRPRAAGEPLHFGYLGTITPKVPIEALVQGWQRAVADGGVPRGSTLTIAGHLGYFASPAAGLARQLDQARAAGVEIRGPVPKTEVGAYYASMDALVLAVGTGRYVTSGKAYEYVAAARPVVAVHDPTNATAEVFEEHPLIARVEAVEPGQIADALARTAQLVVDATPDQHAALARLADRWERGAQLGPAVARLSEVVR